jgi:metal-responsive CopG/Arc/MetJ family transcriptional regulator
VWCVVVLGGMRIKTSVSLPGELLEKIDEFDSNRSAFLERAAWWYLAASAKSRRDAKDAVILERIVEELNGESDVLAFQGLPE